MWVESHISGKPFGWCRSCHYKWSSEKSDAIWTPEEKAAFAAKRKELNQREEQRIREYAENVVMKQEIYKRYFETMKTSQYGNDWLRRKGFNSREEQRIREYAENVVMKQEIYKRYFETMKTSQYGNDWLRRKG